MLKFTFYIENYGVYICNNITVQLIVQEPIVYRFYKEENYFIVGPHCYTRYSCGGEITYVVLIPIQNLDMLSNTYMNIQPGNFSYVT